MEWWLWIIVGCALLTIELAVIDAAFYLVLIGAAGILVGIAKLLVPGIPVTVELLGFAVLSIVFAVFLRKTLYNKIRRASGYSHRLIGSLVKVTDHVPPNGRTRVEYRGAGWDAVNIGTVPIEAGATARVSGEDGIELKIEVDDSSSGGSGSDETGKK